MADQGVDEQTVVHVSIDSYECWPVHESRDKRLLVRFEFPLPPILADYDSQSHRARVRHELSELRTSAVARAIESINQSSGLLELDREEVSSRDVLSSALNAALVSAALEYLIAPEVKAGTIAWSEQSFGTDLVRRNAQEKRTSRLPTSCR